MSPSNAQSAVSVRNHGGAFSLLFALLGLSFLGWAAASLSVQSAQPVHLDNATPAGLDSESSGPTQNAVRSTNENTSAPMLALAAPNPHSQPVAATNTSSIPEIPAAEPKSKPQTAPSNPAPLAEKPASEEDSSGSEELKGIQLSLRSARALAAQGKFEEARIHFHAAIQDAASAPEQADAAFGQAWCEAKGACGEIHLETLERILSNPCKSWGTSQAAFERAQRYSFDFAKGSNAAGESARAHYQLALLSGGLDQPQEELCLDYLNRLTQTLILDPQAACTTPLTVFYTVLPGDSLFRIARKFGVDAGQICRLNQLKANASLLAGKELRLVTGIATLEVDRAKLTGTLRISDVFIRRYAVGIGPEMKTPAGRFTIRKKVVNPDWYFHGRRIPYGHPEHMLGTRWMGFDTEENGGRGASLGIHGTPNGEGVPGRESQGCVRMRNSDVEELYDFLPAGSVVEISE